jgi:hypothetical protein
MPVCCQGNQDGPCPFSCSDSTVKYTIYDLFLCPQCVRIREGQQISPAKERADITAIASKKGRKTKGTGVLAKIGQQPTRGSSTAIAAIADGIPSQSTSTMVTAEVACDRGELPGDERKPSHQGVKQREQGEKSALRDASPVAAGLDQPLAVPTDSLTELRQVISSQCEEINKLRCQLNYVLSFLGITDSIEETYHDVNLPSPDGYSPKEPQVVSPDQALSNDVHEHWSEVKSKRQRQQQRRNETLQQSVVAAMYVDQSLKKSRESSLIVAGLESTAGSSDAELFASICTAEFNIKPDIVSTKRLGHIQVGKTQSLLVYLKQVDQAQQLINSAKRLRQSFNPSTRERVFINPNLTKAEAAAVYQVRQLRRQHAVQRRQHSRNDKPPTGDKSTTNNCSLQSSNLDANNTRPLNPSADPFILPSYQPTAESAE